MCNKHIIVNEPYHSVLFNSCNTGTSGLPDMYTRSTRAAGPRASGVHIRQATSACVTTIMYHFLSELTQQLKLRVRSICGDCIYSVACEFRL